MAALESLERLSAELAVRRLLEGGEDALAAAAGAGVLDGGGDPEDAGDTTYVGSGLAEGWL